MVDRESIMSELDNIIGAVFHVLTKDTGVFKFVNSDIHNSFKLLKQEYPEILEHMIFKKGASFILEDIISNYMLGNIAGSEWTIGGTREFVKASSFLEDSYEVLAYSVKVAVEKMAVFIKTGKDKKEQ